MRTVLITGSANGIGRAAALSFARAGYNIIINGVRDKEALDSLYNEISAMNVKCVSVLKDVSQFDEVVLLFEELKKLNMMPDILVNNAGISMVGLLQDMSASDWNRIVSVNLSSAFNVSKQVIPHMVEKGFGRIINISSMWGNVGASCEAAYSATKGGINSLTKALAKELAPSGIAVNAVAFGMVDTRMNDFLSEEDKNDIRNDIPAGRILSADEAGDIIRSVAELSDYITGQIITADGGYT